MDPSLRLAEPAAGDVPVWTLTKAGFGAWLEGQPPETAAWARHNSFEAKAGTFLQIPAAEGAVGGVALGVSDPFSLWDTAALPAGLGDGAYRLQGAVETATQAALGWALGVYGFHRYRQAPEPAPAATLAWPEGCDRAYVARAEAACRQVRDLVNTPAADMGPEALAEAALAVGDQFSAQVAVTVGGALLDSNYPMIHAVGRGAAQEPRLVDLRWGEQDHPAVTLVGKGVCFDSGGLDLKTADGMALMKKDMGGAATALGLASMIMDAGFPVRLRVLIPVVENSVSANSYRPGDVLSSRKGLSVEIGNTDAEGRLVLADALAEADAGAPALLVDFATLTGSARIALGPDVPALYATNEADRTDLTEIGRREDDPMWPMPLWDGYEELIESKIADLNNAGTSRFAGSITAALFLRHFVTASPRWVHLDLYAWNQKSRPGRPEGGEAQTMRAIYRLIERDYTGR